MVIFFLDLIPLVGATIGAVVVGIVTVFNDFPTATIIWVIWSIVYQQVENNLIQPQIQKRAVDINPFLVVVSVLFGSALLGVLGALVAVPVAASIQIARARVGRLARHPAAPGRDEPIGAARGEPPPERPPVPTGRRRPGPEPDAGARPSARARRRKQRDGGGDAAADHEAGDGGARRAPPRGSRPAGGASW